MQRMYCLSSRTNRLYTRTSNVREDQRSTRKGFSNVPPVSVNVELVVG